VGASPLAAELDALPAEDKAADRGWHRAPVRRRAGELTSNIALARR
jgi:hypothetical protein